MVLRSEGPTVQGSDGMVGPLGPWDRRLQERNRCGGDGSKMVDVRAVVSVLIAVLSVVVTAGAQQFRTTVDVVRLPVVVADRHGLPVRGLLAADFEVLEDGKPQKISYFTEGVGGDQVALRLGLLLDTSDSMGGDLKQAADAAVRFVRAMEEAEDTTLVDFDTTVRIGRFEPPSYPTLFERIRSREAKGFTALYDALGLYLDAAMSRDGHHVLVLYTDGGDSRSRMTITTLQSLLRMSNVVVYALGYMENQTSSMRLTQQSQLTQIARETGGEAFFPTSSADVNRFYTRIREELLFRYTLGYIPATPVTDDKFRKVEVRLVRSEIKNIKVRTRSGYIPARRAG